MAVSRNTSQGLDRLYLHPNLTEQQDLNAEVAQGRCLFQRISHADMLQDYLGYPKYGSCSEFSYLITASLGCQMKVKVPSDGAKNTWISSGGHSYTRLSRGQECILIRPKP